MPEEERQAEPQPEKPAAPQSGRAVTSLWMGLGSFVLSVLTGLPAVLIGLRALREARGSGHATASRALATAGILSGIIGTLASPFLYLYVYIPPIQEFREQRAADACARNLSFIGAALTQYHNTWGVYPPTYVVDDAGNRIHSWRALLTPHLNLYTYDGKYDFSEPWNAPANQPLIDRCPPLLQCPNDVDKGLTTTSYVAVTGPGLVFDGTRSISSKDIPADASKTLVFVELNDSGIKWTQPDDITIDELIERHKNRTVGQHGEFYHAMMADGRILRIPYAIKPELVRTWFTIIDEREEKKKEEEAAANGTDESTADDGTSTQEPSGKPPDEEP